MFKKKPITLAVVLTALVFLFIFCKDFFIPKAEKHELDELLSSKAGGADVRISTEVKVGNRIANYTLELSDGSSMINRDNGKTYTLRSLSRYTGEKYCEMSYSDENGDYTLSWYYPSGRDDLKYLISKSKSGTRAVWKFYDFDISECVDESRMPEESRQLYEKQKKNTIANAEKYIKNADTSPYTLGEMLSLIYGTSSAEDIESIEFSPPISAEYPNTYGDEYTSSERRDIDKIYDIISEIKFYGMESFYGKSELRKDIVSELSKEELNKGSDSHITIKLKNGEIIDDWIFDPVVGNLYGYGNRCSEIISQEYIKALSDIVSVKK